MNKGVLAIFGFSTGSSAYTLDAYANLYKVPFISLSEPIDKKIQNFKTENADSNHEQLNQKKNSRKRDKDFNEEYEEDASDFSTDDILNEYQINMFPDIVPLLVSLIKYNRWKVKYQSYF